jgi:hypothetical protein
VWRRGSMCEHSPKRYVVRDGASLSGILDSRMSQLPTNPILAAPVRRLADRRISAGFIVDTATGAPGHLLPYSSALDRRPVISTDAHKLRRGRRPQAQPGERNGESGHAPEYALALHCARHGGPTIAGTRRPR